MRRLRILTVISLVLAFLVFKIKNRAPSTIPAGDGLLVDRSWMQINKHPLTPQQDVRLPDQTFLTFPEWFLVFSPAEQADYFKTHTSTGFPYLKHVNQMWKGYNVVYHQIKGNYPFNTGYHVMIMVIAGSTTIEYGLKSFYETIVGHVTDTRPGEQMTAEDQFNARYECSYVKFIEALPWYEYDFTARLKQLWTTVPVTGPHLLRKLERRYYLTTELSIKSAYGWLIGLGTKSAYETALLNTAVIVDRLPANIADHPEIKNIRHLADGTILIDLPRYADFNPAVRRLSKSGVSFKEIAGNKGAIMLTVLTAKRIPDNAADKILFTQPIFTKPGLNRVALVTTVKSLNTVVNNLLNNKAVIEHIYDY